MTVARAFAAALINALGATSLELLPEPTTLKQAQRHVFSKEWIFAEGEEYTAYEVSGTWVIVLVLLAGHRALPTKWVYKYKLTAIMTIERFKARLVVCGNRQDVDLWRETFAAVVRATTLKVLMAIVAAFNLECDQGDVITAFLNSLLYSDEVVYIRLPNS